MLNSQEPAAASDSTPVPAAGFARSSPQPNRCRPRSTSRLAMPAQPYDLLITAVVGLATDLVTKHLAFTNLPWNRPRVLIPGILSLDRSLNIGALFGIGKGMSLLFILASVLAVAFVAYMFATSHRRQWVVHLALGLVLAAHWATCTTGCSSRWTGDYSRRGN